MSKNTVKLLMVGIGGYGHYYIDALNKNENKALIELAAIVDPMAEAAPDWLALNKQNIPTFSSVEAFLQSDITVDLAAIVSPISFHADQTCSLLQSGIHVLCEKPIAATIAEAERMRVARDASGKFLQIGYQWSFSEAIQNLKKDILNGVFGKAEKLRTRVSWSRTSAYYARNDWAGRIHNSRGEAVYDSPVNNATAHYLHNMLYILGPALHLSARPIHITAECYRANPIENYDTACCRIKTAEGPELYFYTTHAVEADDGPTFSYQFQNAEICYENGGDIIAFYNDGSTKNYGNPESDPLLKLQICAERCLAEDKHGSVCSVEAACAHTHCVSALQKIPVHTIASDYLMTKDLSLKETLTYIPNMKTYMRSAFESSKLFSELNLNWSAPSTSVFI